VTIHNFLLGGDVMMETRFGRLQSLLLGIVLAIGAALVWALAVTILTAMVTGLFPSRTIKQGFYERLFVLLDGTPVIESGNNGYLTPDHKRIPDSKHIGDLPTLTGSDLFGPECPKQDTLAWGHRIVGTWSSGEDKGRWYFVHDATPYGRGYFVGYDDETNLPIGCMGRDGFQRDIPAADQQFIVGGSKMFRSQAVIGPHENTWYLVADDGLMKIDLKARTIKPLWKGSDLISAAIAPKDSTAQQKTSEDTPQALVILLRTPNKVIALNFDGTVHATYVLPAEMQIDNFGFALFPNNQAFIRLSSRDKELFWIDTSGKIVRHERVDLRHEDSKFYLPWPNRIAHYALMAFVVPSPGGIVGVLICNPWDIYNTPWRMRAMDYSTALWQALQDVRLLLAVNSVISVIVAFLCYRRQRKYGLTWTWAWVAFVLLFGLPAYFGYLAHRTWPARLACPNCGKRVPRDRPACFACGREFPPPALKGIEVFA
jgi:hypothetical protein